MKKVIKMREDKSFSFSVNEIINNSETKLNSSSTEMQSQGGIYRQTRVLITCIDKEEKSVSKNIWRDLFTIILFTISVYLDYYNKYSY